MDVGERVAGSSRRNHQRRDRKRRSCHGKAGQLVFWLRGLALPLASFEHSLIVEADRHAQKKGPKPIARKEREECSGSKPKGPVHDWCSRCGEVDQREKATAVITATPNTMGSVRSRRRGLERVTFTNVRRSGVWSGFCMRRDRLPVSRCRVFSTFCPKAGLADFLA